MPCVDYMVANPSIRKCGNFDALRVSGFVVQKVWPPLDASLALLILSTRGFLV